MSFLACLGFWPSVDWLGVPSVDRPVDRRAPQRSTDGQMILAYFKTNSLVGGYAGDRSTDRSTDLLHIGRPAGRPTCSFPGQFCILRKFDTLIWLILSRVLTWDFASMFIYIYGCVWESGTTWSMDGLAPAPWHRLFVKWLFIYPGYRLLGFVCPQTSFHTVTLVSDLW